MHWTTKAAVFHRRLVLFLGTLFALWLGIGVTLQRTSWCGAASTSVREGPLYDLVHRAAKAHELPAALITAVIQAESNFDPNAVSSRGAKGLMQINGITAKHLLVKNVFDPEENVHAGARYLKYLVERFDGNILYALAAYNAGPSTVKRFRGIPPYPETRRYIKKVMSYYKDHQHLFL